MTTPRIPRIALVGDRSPHVAAHGRIPARLAHLPGGLAAEGYWIATHDVDDRELAGFDGIWLVPGSPYASERGALRAVRVARERRIPFLGTCGGFQHALLEFARNVAGVQDAAHQEQDPDAATPLISRLGRSMVGHTGAINLFHDGVAARAVGSARRLEPYNCSYGLDPAFEPRLMRAGLAITGRDDAGSARIIELPLHPFFVATLFQPELSPDPSVHPLIVAFVEAARARCARAAA